MKGNKETQKTAKQALRKTKNKKIVYDLIESHLPVSISSNEIFLLLSLGAGVIYVVVKNKKNKEERIPKCVADFNESFAEYVDSIKMGAVSEKKIDKVVIALEEIKRNQEKETITITFSVENISLLLGMVRDYTMKFAEANSFEIQEEDIKEYDEIDGLQHYLKIQKQIFEKCA